MESAAGLAKLAKRYDKLPVITTAFESGVAHCHVSFLCAAFGGTGNAHGLSTYERLEDDVMHPPFASSVRADLIDIERAQYLLDNFARRRGGGDKE